jgi:hypothetical protein
MMKIKSIKQLRAQREHINHRLDYLEHSMQQQWRDVKHGLIPSNIIKESVGNFLKSKTEPGFGKGSLLKGLFTYGVSLLAGKLADKARRKFSAGEKK